jgi:hypothetical protein
MTCLLICTVSFAVFAQQGKDTIMGKEKMEGGMMGDMGMMMNQGSMMGMCPMHEMMMRMMMSKSLVTTEDGGIVVMVGNKLLKYDSNLELKKEVEIKMDMEGMQKTMMQMQKNCPVCRQMMKGDGMMGETMKESIESSAPEEKSEHEAHHE